MAEFDPYNDEWGLPRKTDFINNAFGIDPEGCGCTDCILRYAVHPSDEWTLGKIIESGRTLHNRTGRAVRLPNGVTLEDDEQWPPKPGGAHCPGCRCQ